MIPVINLTTGKQMYTNEDIKFIESNYNKLSYREIAKVLCKTEVAISTKVNKMGLIKKIKWSNAEINVLLVNYASKNNTEIKKMLPNRKLEDIRNMSVKLGLRKITPFEKHFSKTELLLSLRQVAKEIGRTPLASELKSYGLPHAKTWERYFGGYILACRDAGLEPNGSFHGTSVKGYSKNGDYCASKAELTITNYFIDTEIFYEKEVLYSKIISSSKCKNKKMDWLLDNSVVVEYFGLPEKESYMQRMIEKRNLCREHNIQLIELYRKDLNKLDNIFKAV